MGNDDAARRRGRRAADAVGEGMWPMPLPGRAAPRPGLPGRRHRQRPPATAAAACWSAGSSCASSSPTGIPWAHIDIAGPATTPARRAGYTPKGGTGVPVRTLLATIEALIADCGLAHGRAPPARAAGPACTVASVPGGWSCSAGAPVAHPLGVADHLGVVDRDRRGRADSRRGDVGAVDPAPGPLAVGGDQHDRRLGDGGPRLDVTPRRRAGWRRTARGGLRSP